MRVNQFAIREEKVMTKEHREHINEYVPEDGNEDVEAHRLDNRRIPSVAPEAEAAEGDVEGHGLRLGPVDEAVEEDVEGHDWKDRLRPPVSTDDDVEGHFQPRQPWDPDQIER